jgi:hypothetical protein
MSTHPSWRKPWDTQRETLTKLIIDGLRHRRSGWTMGELFKEVDLILAMVTINDEKKD